MAHSPVPRLFPRLLRWQFPLTLTAPLLLAASLGLAAEKAAPAASPKPATAGTVQANQTAAQALDFSDQQDFLDARQGFIAPLPDQGRIVDGNGKPVWNLPAYAFLKDGDIKEPGQAPASVHPSLWRQAQLVMIDGLFKVTDRLYQIRNADLSNMTVIEGDTGLIIVDPLISAENAATALKLFYAHRPHKPVKAIIFSHSHVDHYGGALGVTTLADVQAGKVQVIAPEGFLEAAMAENVMAGTAMQRRAQFMYGALLPPGPTGHVGAGLGLANSTGSTSLLPPTTVIRGQGETLQLDGLTFQFLMAPNTEAPAEMHWYIPELKALTAAENCTHTMHNLYTLRGAKARDPLRWSQALDETVARFGGQAEVLYSMHHWPVWGRERVKATLNTASDLYRYINDQTLHLANQGKTMLEIAEELRLPPELARHFAARGYYGSLSHNVKGTYNFYLGWFDGNPARLHPLPPVEAARRYVEYMGGADAVLERARKDFTRGEYRWVAQVLDHVVFADPKNQAARELAADTLEQLGYQAESGPWRNFYLSGAQELRGLDPVINQSARRHEEMAGTKTNAQVGAQARNLPPDLYFASLGPRLDGPRAWGRNIQLLAEITDKNEQWLIELRNGTFRATPLTAEAQEAAGTIKLKGKMAQIVALFEGTLDADKAAQAGIILGDAGDTRELRELVSLFDRATPNFPLALP